MTSESTTARVTLSHLDELWFQVTGTRCNLTCNHCFISCSPHNNSFGFLSRTEIQKSLEESKQLGVKGYYFTGGEPFLHPEMVEILEDTSASTRVVTDFVARARGIVVIIAIRIYNVDRGVDG